MPVIAATDETFHHHVSNSPIPVLVDFGTDWCAPCKQIEPVLDEISDMLLGQVKIVKVNIDDAPSAAARMAVRGIPALFFIKDGEVVANRTGAASKTALKDWLLASI
jgi:thioredoxin 1